MKKPLFLFYFLLLFSCKSPQTTETAQETYPAYITAVVDGDTVDLRFTGSVPDDCDVQERIRLVGIDTPELFTDPPQDYAAEARAFTNQFWHTSVRFRFDAVSDIRDRYGRLLGYIFPDDEPDDSINFLLVRYGLAVYYDAFPFEPQMMHTFSQAQKLAFQDAIGLWQ
jgi:endonuclease YncB( thermonuclease family)